MPELQPCGTPAAYQRHRYYGEIPCDPCTVANTEQNWQYRDRSSRDVRCGTVGGHRRHVRRGEPICDHCRAAHAARMRRWRQVKKAERIRHRIIDSVIDVLSAEARWLNFDTLADRVLELHPEWKRDSVKRVLYTAVQDGRVERRIDPDCPQGLRHVFFCDEWAVAS